MNFSIVIGSPFMSAEKFADLTGQTVCAVVNQLNDGQLPVFVLPPSVKQKDPKSSRRKRFVDTTRLVVEGLKRAGEDVVINS